MEEKIRKAIEAVLPDVDFTVERPANSVHGDYTTNAAMAAAKKLASPKAGGPREVAEELAGKLKDTLGASAERVEVAGPRFINITLSREAVMFAVAEADAKGEKWGRGTENEGKRIMVEYTDPNPFKEFHIGHLMSNAIGEGIAGLFEASGARVSRANYQGDLGVHVAKAIWGKQQKPEASWGEAYVWGSEQYETHKEEIDTLNKTIYEKTDLAINALYDEGRAESLEHFEKIYKVLGTKFAFYFFESEVGPIGLEIVKKHPEVFEESDGAIVFKGEAYGLHNRVFVDSKGLPTYEAKELGLVEAKKKRGDFDISLTVTANEISEYFKVVRKAAELVFPDLEGKMLARFHGFLKLTTGKMSSRKGNVITGESLIEDLTEAASGRQDVAVGAIKYALLKSGVSKDIIFDPEKSLSLEGDSGPYLQYALVRARALLRKASGATVTEFVTPQSKTLERVLVHYSDAVARAAKEMEPHCVTTYLTELAAEFNSWYAAERAIVDGTIAGYTLSLVKVVEHTLSQGLNLLGIPTPEEM